MMYIILDLYGNHYFLDINISLWYYTDITKMY